MDAGSVYEVETQASWEDLAERRLRVSIAVDDGGWNGSSPLTDGFVVAPEGTFVGE